LTISGGGGHEPEVKFLKKREQLDAGFLGGLSWSEGGRGLGSGLAASKNGRDRREDRSGDGGYGIPYYQMLCNLFDGEGEEKIQRFV